MMIEICTYKYSLKPCCIICDKHVYFNMIFSNNYTLKKNKKRHTMTRWWTFLELSRSYFLKQNYDL